jgi:pyruvate kinase
MAANETDGKAGVLETGCMAQALRELLAIRQELVAEPARLSAHLQDVHPKNRASAVNLLHYLALRRRDLRPLQLVLATLGLSSLGRAESHVLATVDALLEVLHRLSKLPWQPPVQETMSVDFAAGERLLNANTDALLGTARSGRWVRIMVTMPSEAAEDYSLVHDLLQAGMDCMRINCAQDDVSKWSQMIQHLRRAEQALGCTCRVVMDLAGPKLRTGPLEPGPSVVKVRPRRNVYGQVTAPARIWITGTSSPQPPPYPADANLTVDSAWLARLRHGDRIRFRDARDSRRAFTVLDVNEDGCWLESTKTAYVVPGAKLVLQRLAAGMEDLYEACVGDLPSTENPILLQPGDTLILTRNLNPGRVASYDSGGQKLTPAKIGCTLPQVFDDVRPGESIFFDDGKIGGVVDKVDQQQALIRITRTRVGGEKLRGNKGINLPDSHLRLHALTDKDLEDLQFAAQQADLIELSFANTPQDVELLQQNLSKQGSRQPAIVLKIETRRGFENLPEMLLTAMQAPGCGVMIARGDLAVECGFERLAEVQEEILWICEAAHVPVIWATQVLESLAKEGLPSRAEITDAAMGDRAECVMLNKGPHVISAVRVLDGILRRMQMHQAKKRSMLRELKLAHALPPK